MSQIQSLLDDSKDLEVRSKAKMDKLEAEMLSSLNRAEDACKRMEEAEKNMENELDALILSSVADQEKD